MASLSLQLILVPVVVTAGLYDLRYRRIPNWLNLVALLLGFAVHWNSLPTALLGVGLALAVYLPLYLLRGMGAGDVKLMLALGAIAGPAHWFDIFVASALIGALLGIILALARRRFTHTLLNLQHIIRELWHLRAPHDAAPQLDVRNPYALRLPHGVSIALGCLAVLAIPATL